MQRAYTLQIGVDGPNLTLPAGPKQIAGVTVDNPSGSWLRISPVEDYVPPYTMGWARTLSPASLSVNVRWTDSPSGTPSSQIGYPAIVTVYDTPIPYSDGAASGAQEIQQPRIGNIQQFLAYRTITEDFADIAINFPAPSVIQRVALLRSRIVPGEVSTDNNGDADGVRDLRARAWIVTRNAGGVDLFPPAVITPEAPDSGWLPPTSAVLAVGEVPLVSAVVSQGGGAANVVIFFEYYLVTEV